MSWQQSYDPLGSAVLSTIAAALPVVVLLVLLAVFGACGRTWPH